MANFPFNWKLQRGNTYHQTKNCYTSNLKINTKWSMVCLWSEYAPNTPQFLEIRRSSTANEILVSGNFKLMGGTTCLLQRKFTQLIDAGYECATTLIDLECNITRRWNDPYCNSTFSITGTLTIPAEMTNKTNTKGVQFESLLNLSTDFERLLHPKVTFFADVSLKCDAVSFLAHKSILSARSPVFAAMFANQMKENRDNKVDITDISTPILKIMLTYLYTGKTGDLSVESASELLFAADKYQLKDLKRVCSDFLMSCVSTQNVLNALVLGDLHDGGLKVFALEFICNSSEEFEVLEKTTEWKTLRHERPALAMDVLTHLVKSKDEKLKGKRN